MGLWSQARITITYQINSKFSPQKAIRSAVAKYTDEYTLWVESNGYAPKAYLNFKPIGEDLTRRQFVFILNVSADGLEAAQVFNEVKEAIVSRQTKEKPIYFSILTNITF